MQLFFPHCILVSVAVHKIRHFSRVSYLSLINGVFILVIVSKSSLNCTFQVYSVCIKLVVCIMPRLTKMFDSSLENWAQGAVDMHLFISTALSYCECRQRKEQNGSYAQGSVIIRNQKSSLSFDFKLISFLI